MRYWHCSILGICFLLFSCSSLPTSSSPTLQRYQTYYQRGMEALKSEMCGEAGENFKKALSLKETVEAWNNLGVSLEACGYFEKALEAYQNALKIAKKDKQKTIIKANIEKVIKERK